MKKLLGVFNTKTMTPAQIFERTKKAIQENERLELLEMAKTRGKRKNEIKTSSLSSTRIPTQALIKRV